MSAVDPLSHDAPIRALLNKLHGDKTLVDHVHRVRAIRENKRKKMNANTKQKDTNET